MNRFALEILAEVAAEKGDATAVQVWIFLSAVVTNRVTVVREAGHCGFHSSQVLEIQGISCCLKKNERAGGESGLIHHQQQSYHLEIRLLRTAACNSACRSVNNRSRTSAGLGTTIEQLGGHRTGDKSLGSLILDLLLSQKFDQGKKWPRCQTCSHSACFIKSMYFSSTAELRGASLPPWRCGKKFNPRSRLKQPKWKQKIQ